MLDRRPRRSGSSAFEAMDEQAARRRPTRSALTVPGVMVMVPARIAIASGGCRSSGHGDEARVQAVAAPEQDEPRHLDVGDDDVPQHDARIWRRAQRPARQRPVRPVAARDQRDGEAEHDAQHELPGRDVVDRAGPRRPRATSVRIGWGTRRARSWRRPPARRRGRAEHRLDIGAAGRSSVAPSPAMAASAGRRRPASRAVGGEQRRDRPQDARAAFGAAATSTAGAPPLPLFQNSTLPARAKANDHDEARCRSSTRPGPGRPGRRARRLEDQQLADEAGERRQAGDRDGAEEEERRRAGRCRAKRRRGDEPVAPRGPRVSRTRSEQQEQRRARRACCAAVVERRGEARRSNRPTRRSSEPIDQTVEKQTRPRSAAAGERADRARRRGYASAAGTIQGCARPASAPRVRRRR